MKITLRFPMDKFDWFEFERIAIHIHSHHHFSMCYAESVSAALEEHAKKFKPSEYQAENLIILNTNSKSMGFGYITKLSRWEPHQKRI